MARFFISFAFSFYLLWVNELYPTTVRSIGNGMIDGMGLIGAEMAPLIVRLSESMN